MNQVATTTATHDAKNIGPSRYREVMVEMK